MSDSKPLVESLPHPQAVRDRLGDALREVELLQKLLRLAERAELYRERDREVARERGGPDRAA